MSDKKARLKEIGEQISALSKEKYELELSIATETARFNVGDKVRWDYGSKGRKVGEVVDIRMRCGEAVFMVRTIRADGSLGALKELPWWRKPSIVV